MTGAGGATIALLAAGVAFLLVGSVGLLRLPDFYCRLHALSKADTLGMLLILLAVAAWQGASLASAKVLLIAVFFFLSNPVAAHALARAAFRTGLRPQGAVEERSP